MGVKIKVAGELNLDDSPATSNFWSWIRSIYEKPNFLSHLILSQKLEKEKAAREKAEAERKRLEEEIAALKASQEKQARGIIWKCY